MKGGVLLPTLLVCLLSRPASAWGPFATKFVCNEAIKFSWGVEAAAECLPSTDRATLEEFCGMVYDVMGSEYETKCLSSMKNGSFPHPALMSYEVFKDSKNHFDFSRCPISQGNTRMWVCGDGKSPAKDMYGKWLKEAESAPNKCLRIYAFCVAASYYADSQSALNQVKYVSNDCTDHIASSIDRCLMDGSSDCSASEMCRFDNFDPGLGKLYGKEKIGESTSTLNKVITDLTPEAARLKELPYVPRKGVVLLANSIDLGYAQGFVEYLRANGVNIIVSNASDFQRLRYNDKIIALGGQNAPEGVGEVTSSLLFSEEKDQLLAPQAAKMFVKEGIWTTGQRVLVLAGNEAQDTGQACSENQQKVLDEVKGG